MRTLFAILCLLQCASAQEYRRTETVYPDGSRIVTETKTMPQVSSTVYRFTAPAPVLYRPLQVQPVYVVPQPFVERRGLFGRTVIRYYR